MKVGIDGNAWYVSNWLCLGDVRARFGFGCTLKEAVEDYKRQFGGMGMDSLTPELREFADLTTDQYRALTADIPKAEGK